MLLIAAAVATLAFAKVREYGLEPAPRPEADCPGEPCRATGRVTGFQTRNVRDGKAIRYPTEVRRNGWLVGFSVTLGRPNKSQRTFFDRLWGKPAKAGVSVLRPAPTRKYPGNAIHRYELVAKSRVFPLNEWFDTKAWFAIGKRIYVKRKDVIALTIPTWAPVLATDRSKRERWRGSRKFGRCNDVTPHAEHERSGSAKRYRCLYTTARLLYTALVVDLPRPAKRNR